MSSFGVISYSGMVTKGFLLIGLAATLAGQGAVVQVSPASLQFSAIQGGNTPGPQNITVMAPGTTPAAFTVQLDSGTTGSAAPSWLSVSPLSDSTPAILTVTASPGTLPAGVQTGRILIVPQYQTPIAVTVNLTITSAPPQLTVVPPALQFTLPFGSTKVQQESLLVRDSGGGSVSFTTSVVNGATWIKSVTPASGQTATDLPVILKVNVSGQGLAVGTLSDVIRFTWAGNTTDIPVTLTVRATGSVLKLGATGIDFETEQGNAIPDNQPLSVINAGDAGTAVNFTTAVLTGSDWLSVSVPKNQATPTSPGMLVLQPLPVVATFPAGARTALVQVTDPNSQNSPEFITVVLQVDPTTAPAPPNPSPAGVLFVATAGSAAPPTQPISLNYSSAALVAYQTSAVTTNGGTWLSVSPANGNVSTARPANLTVAASPAGLKAGVYAGTLSIVVGSSLRTIQVTMVVRPGAAASVASARDATTCTPTQLVLVQTELPGDFVVVAGFPAFLSVQVNDDCGNPVLDASVISEFSNGDPPLRLDSDDATGFYSASWVPGEVFPGMTINFDATEPNLLSPSNPTEPAAHSAKAASFSPAGAYLTGTVATNPNPLPVLAPGGTVNNANPVSFAPLAPGTAISIYGSQLATSETAVAFPTLFQGTSITIGGVPAPLYYVSPTQVNAQIPFEVPANQSFPVVATLNGLSSVPEIIQIAPATPGVFSYSGGLVSAFHGSSSSLVGPSSPAKPGEVLVIFLVGMGQTTPPAMTGTVVTNVTSPSLPVTVTVDGQPASVSYAGSSPGFVGLYQINFTVPANARTGTLNLVVTEKGITSNVTGLTVSQ